MSNIAVEELQRKRAELIVSQMDAWNEFQVQLDEIDRALVLLTGEKINGLIPRPMAYDDENPHYIRNTEDGI